MPSPHMVILKQTDDAIRRTESNFKYDPITQPRTINIQTSMMTRIISVSPAPTAEYRTTIAMKVSRRTWIAS